MLLNWILSLHSHNFSRWEHKLSPHSCLLATMISFFYKIRYSNLIVHVLTWVYKKTTYLQTLKNCSLHNISIFAIAQGAIKEYLPYHLVQRKGHVTMGIVLNKLFNNVEILGWSNVSLWRSTPTLPVSLQETNNWKIQNLHMENTTFRF